jgi:hypothetical protein
VNIVSEKLFSDWPAEIFPKNQHARQALPIALPFAPQGVPGVTHVEHSPGRPNEIRAKSLRSGRIKIAAAGRPRARHVLTRS